MPKRNVSGETRGDVSFTHQKHMCISKSLIILIIFGGNIFFMSTSLLFKLSMLQNKTSSLFKFTRFDCTVKPDLGCHSKRKPKIGFHDRLSLNAGQKYCRMLQECILQYFRPSFSYHLSLRPLFCLFLSGRLRQVLL